MHGEYLREIGASLDHFKTTNPKEYKHAERELQKLVEELRYEQAREAKRLSR